MLTHLAIQNFALVSALELEFGSGMTAITGETGAGKSILLDALGLTLGDRADMGVIRQDCDRADITATFLLTQQAQALAWLAEQEIAVEDNTCLLRRVLSRDGRSRAWINGQPCTLTQLSQLGGLLIDIHSQHEHQSLLKTSTHQLLVDTFGQLETQALKVRTLAQQHRKLLDTLESLQQTGLELRAQQELLTYQVQELQELNPKKGEFAELEAEHQRLTHAESILSTLQAVASICSENENFNLEQGLSRTVALLQDIPHRTPLLEETIGLLESAKIQVEEASRNLDRAAGQVELNPERLQDVDNRLGALHSAARKHRRVEESLPEYLLSLEAELTTLSKIDERSGEIQAELDKIFTEYSDAACQLSRARKKAGDKLEKAVNQELYRLGMASAKLSLAYHAHKAEEIHPQGFEQIELLISTNPGQEPKPLVKIASGGELSRVSLAIQVVIAQNMSIPTLVFDEVDVGIGGATAKVVGELLRGLGTRGQVLCVTHQAQVAAQSHQHLLVSKHVTNESTETSLVLLNKKERVSEVARMLGGDENSIKSLAHATELLSQVS